MVRFFSVFVAILLLSSVIPAVYQVFSVPVSPFIVSPLTATLPSSGGKWTSIGPSPIQGCNNIASNNYCSGRVSAIALDPLHPGTIYIGGAVGGVWKSANEGSTWVPLTDNQPSLAIGSIAVDPSVDVYAGTGD